MPVQDAELVPRHREHRGCYKPHLQRRARAEAIEITVLQSCLVGSPMPLELGESVFAYVATDNQVRAYLVTNVVHDAGDGSCSPRGEPK